MYTKKRIYVFCNIVLVLLNIFGCGINIDEKRYESSPSASPATESGSATLSWQAPATDAHGSTLYDLGGYKIYYRLSSNNDTRSIDVGNLTEIKQKMGSKFELINLDGATLLPGFIDSHMHPIMFIFFLVNLDLTDVKSIKDLRTLIRETATKKNSSEWIIGLRLNEEVFTNPEERTLPTRWQLDEICSENPIFLVRYDGHIGVANSKALEIAGITAETEVPEGGEIRKNEKGEITGIISEEALNLLFSKMSFPKPSEIMEGAEKAFKILAEKGITSICGLVEYDRGRGVEFSIMKSIRNKVLQNWYCLVTTEDINNIIKIKKVVSLEL